MSDEEPQESGSNQGISLEIDIQRLIADIGITKEDLLLIEALDIPEAIRVPSASIIKTETVADVLRIVQPDRQFNIIGVKVPSAIGEQPLGQTTINGAINRLNNGITAREQLVPKELNSAAWFSIENGLFEASAQDSEQIADVPQGTIVFTEGANLVTEYNPTAEYDDRAVTVIRIPGHPIIVQISPDSEAVRFPRAAIRAAYEAEGGFMLVTAGAKLKEMGLVQNNQNPHTELTVDRPGGPLPRQDQLARVMIR
ncbi:MAG: DUF84 family protein, partial [Candidatus Roizmanbacteria bacterium]